MKGSINHSEIFGRQIPVNGDFFYVQPKEGVAVHMLIFPKGVADKMEKLKLQNLM